MSGRTKLTDEDVRVIRKRHSNGATIKMLAFDYGVHLNTISSIVRGLSRKSVK